MSRGRPSEQLEILRKYNQVFYEYPTKPKLGEIATWYYDKDKAPNGPYKTETIFPKGYKTPKTIIEKGKAYGKLPVVMVFKTSNRSNAKIKMKVWNNENVDYILTSKKLPGVPEIAEILEVGVGSSYIKHYQEKYDLP